MEKEMQNRITADIAAFRLPRYAQIPEVGLYLEQVVLYQRPVGTVRRA